MRTTSILCFLALWFAAVVEAGYSNNPTSGSLFPRPAAIKPAVAFWTRVYTEAHSNSGFIHDDRYLGVVYDTLQLDPKASGKDQQKQIRAAIERYRDVLRSLASGKRDNLSRDERKVLGLWGENVSNSRLRDAAERLRFQRGQANKFREGVIRSGAWKEEIRGILAELGLPTELAALPHVESSYNPGARSHAGAAGMWQFMRSTGRRYMQIDHVVDERLDPHKASEAAARLLQHNYSVLKSWPLALTAYNHGLAGMRQAVSKTGTSDIGTIVTRYDGKLFGFASRNFYAAFLAALDVSENPQRYFGKLPIHSPSEAPSVPVSAFFEADDLADLLGVKFSTLRELNPALQPSVWNGEKLVPKGYRLRLPSGHDHQAAVARLRTAALKRGSAAQKPDRYYTVQAGDSLSVIARRYHTRVSSLMAMNQISSSHRIRVGQKLVLPGGKVQVAEAAAEARPVKVAYTVETPPAGEVRPASYRVQAGDSLWGIARRFGVHSTELVALNSITDQRLLRPGQDLKIPGGKGAAETVTETVSAADTQIAEADQAAPDVAEAEIAAEEPAETAPVAIAKLEADVPEGSAPVETQPQLSADPADYTVAADGSIEIQASETLGHYAEWLDTRAMALRRLNHMRFGQSLVIGRRLKLDLGKVSTAEFEKQRVAYHEALQAAYFENHHITATREHRIANGDNLWQLATRDYRVPLWLLRQYNPDLEFDTVLPHDSVVLIPVVEPTEADASPPPAGTSLALGQGGDNQGNAE